MNGRIRYGPSGHVNPDQKEYEEWIRRVTMLETEIEKLREFRMRVIGWREHDWPSGFDRRTAQFVADYADRK